MTPKELADALENVDEEAFASLLLEFELSHDDGPKQVKTMIIDWLDPDYPFLFVLTKLPLMTVG